MTTTSRLVYWNPGVVYGPVFEAHQVAAQEAAQAAQALAPGRIKVSGTPTGVGSSELHASGPGATEQEYGAGPHEIAPGPKKVLAGPGFGPVGATVHHPGNPALHYTRRGAETYRAAFAAALRRLL
jgi:hypothetical protein